MLRPLILVIPVLVLQSAVCWACSGELERTAESTSTEFVETASATSARSTAAKVPDPAVGARRQDPGSPAQGVKLPAAPTETSSGFEFVKSGGAQQRAEEFVASKGWTVGWDMDKGWGVWIGTAPLTAPDATGLALAMQDAQLDAKFQFAEHLAGVTESAVMRTLEKNPGDRQKEIARLDKIAAAAGGDPVAASVRDLLASCPPEADPNVALRSRISSASRTVAQAAIPGMVTVQVYVQTNPDGLEGTASVVLVSTPKSRQIADAMLGKGSTPKGPSGMSIRQFAESLSPEALVYSCGATYRFNEKGELCLVGFGVGSVDAGDGDQTAAAELKIATEEARQAATSDLRSVAGELVVGSRLLSRVGDRTKLLDGTVTSESARSFRSEVSSVAEGLKLPGVTDVYERRVSHPVLGDVMCVVRQWNLSDAKNAANLREQFAKQGGWKGGEGVQPGGTGSTSSDKASRPKGVPSGQGGPGLEDE